MLPFRDSFALVAEQDPSEPGGRFNCWFSGALSAPDCERFTTAPDPPVTRVVPEKRNVRLFGGSDDANERRATI